MLVGGTQSFISSAFIATPLLGFVTSSLLIKITGVLVALDILSFILTRVLRLLIK